MSPGVLPMMAYKGGSARKGYLFQASLLYERVEIWPVEVNLYEREKKSITSVSKKAKKGSQMHFYGSEKWKTDSAFTVL